MAKRKASTKKKPLSDEARANAPKVKKRVKRRFRSLTSGGRPKSASKERIQQWVEDELDMIDSRIENLKGFAFSYAKGLRPSKFKDTMEYEQQRLDKIEHLLKLMRKYILED